MTHPTTHQESDHDEDYEDTETSLSQGMTLFTTPDDHVVVIEYDASVGRYVASSVQCPHAGNDDVAVCTVAVPCEECKAAEATDRQYDGGTELVSVERMEALTLHGQRHVRCGSGTPYLIAPVTCGVAESLWAGRYDWLQKYGAGRFLVRPYYDESGGIECDVIARVE